jgi:hypothetical protein
MVAGPASAEPAGGFELSVVRLEGAASCPSGTAFERLVSARLGRVPFTEPSERTIEALLSRRADTWSAEIILRDASGLVQGRRTIESVGADCEPLTEATALAIAIAIDPNAALGPQPQEPPPAPLPAVPAPPPALEPVPCPSAPCPVVPPCPRAERPPEPALPYLAAFARATLAFGLVPGAAPGVAVGAEAGSLDVRGHFGVLYVPETFADDPRFSFGLTTVAAGACAALHPDESLELGLCGELELGAIHGVVHHATSVDAGDELWLAGALGPRVRFAPFRPLVFEIGLSAVIPFLDRAFDVAGIDDPVFEQAPVGALGFAGVGLRSP